MPKLSLLNKTQQDKIHYAALNVLKTVGCEIQDKRWLEELVKHEGVKVDFKKSRVFILDESVVHHSLESCGRLVKAMARNPENDWTLGQGPPKAHNPEGIPKIIDLATNEHRDTRLSDVIDISKLCDYLPNVDAVIAPVVPVPVRPFPAVRVVTPALVKTLLLDILL